MADDACNSPLYDHPSDYIPSASSTALQVRPHKEIICELDMSMCGSSTRGHHLRAASSTVKILGVLGIVGLVVVILVSQYQSALQSQRASVGGSSSNGGTAAPGTSVSSTFVDSGAVSIVNSIIKLESTSDAKCHSTACRLEDFMYGTPLSDDARNMRWEF